MAPLVENLKEIMNIENLKFVLKPYDRVGFDYLGRMLMLKPEKVRRYVFMLIVDNQIHGKINNIEGYFEKDRGFNGFINKEQQII